MIPQFVINDLGTLVGEKILSIRDPVVCSKARDLLKIRSPWVGLPANLELRSVGNAVLATALIAGEAMVALLFILAASSKLPQPSAEASEPANALLHDTAIPVSADHWNSQTLGSCMGKDAQIGAEAEQLRDDANRRHFQVALLENCSFFADLVLRQVRAGGDRPRELLERNSSREKLNVVRVAPTPPGSKANAAPGQRPEEPAPPKTPSFLLPTLWVEVGCRHLQTLVSERSVHEYGQDSKPAL